jgi:hypothetical protein
MYSREPETSPEYVSFINTIEIIPLEKVLIFLFFNLINLTGRKLALKNLEFYEKNHIITNI